MTFPVLLATDVRIAPGVLPVAIRPEWGSRRHFDCRCGFPAGTHPLCSACGLAVGPDHSQRLGQHLSIDVYVDDFNDTLGIWGVRRTVEERLVCISCFKRCNLGLLQPQPIRRNTHTRDRLVRINSWRRLRGLRALKHGDPSPEGFGEAVPIQLAVSMDARVHLRTRTRLALRQALSPQPEVGRGTRIFQTI